MIQTGIISGETIADYHATDAVSHSKLEVFRDSDRGPARYHGMYVTGVIRRPEATDAQDIGNAADALILEGRVAYTELPGFYRDLKTGTDKPFTRASNTCKATIADIEAKGLIPLHRDDVRLVRAMRAAVTANPTAAAMLSNGVPQLTIRRKFGSFFVQVRPDWRNVEGVTLPDGTVVGHYLCDLKTAEDMGQFLKNRRAFGYDRQLALYREVDRLAMADAGGLPVEEVAPPASFIIVVFKTEPIEAAVYTPSDEDMAEATNEVTDDLRYLRRCYDENRWPGVLAGVQMLPKLWRKAA